MRARSDHTPKRSIHNHPKLPISVDPIQRLGDLERTGLQGHDAPRIARKERNLARIRVRHRECPRPVRRKHHLDDLARTHVDELILGNSVESQSARSVSPLRCAADWVTSPLLKQGPSVTDAFKNLLDAAAPQGVSWRGQGTLQPRGSRGKGPSDGRPTPRRAFPSSVESGAVPTVDARRHRLAMRPISLREMHGLTCKRIVWPMV